MAQELVGAIQEIVATPDRHLSPTAIGELYASSLGLPRPALATEPDTLVPDIRVKV